MRALALILTLLSFPAFAQCPPRSEAVEHLASKYKEQPVGRGVTGRGVLELLVGEDGSTWTIILTTPRGCVGFIAAGTNWQHITPTYKPKGQES